MNRTRCPVCKNTKTNYKSTHQSNELYVCSVCSFEYVPMSKSITPQKPIYTQGYFHGKLSGVKGYNDYDSLNDQLTLEAEKKLRYIKKFTNKKELLDLGSGTGIFLKLARDKGFKVTGNDISKYAIKQLKKNRIKAYAGSVEKKIFPKESFDIITGWDVIEHLYKPAKAMESISSTLKPGGFLFLTTPDTERVDARILGKYWYGYKKIPEHVGFFNTPSIKRLLHDANFEVVEIKPWGFYRNLDFIFSKLSVYSPLFLPIRKILQRLGVSNLNFFFPLTDCIIVAKKE